MVIVLSVFPNVGCQSLTRSSRRSHCARSAEAGERQIIIREAILLLHFCTFLKLSRLKNPILHITTGITGELPNAEMAVLGSG